MLTKTLILADRPKTLKVLDKLGGVVEKMPVDEFIALAKSSGNTLTEWSEQMEYDDIDIPVVSKNTQAHTKKEFKKLNKEAKLNSAKLALCYIDEKIGWGLIATQQINANECIGFYAGIWGKKTLEGKSHAYQCGIKIDETMFFGNAETKGNLTRFILHAFEKESRELQKYKIKTKKPLLLANIQFRSSLYQGKPFASLFSTTTIKPGMMLGYDYGMLYWEALDISPCLFDQFGSLLKSPSDYEVVKFDIVVKPKTNMAQVLSLTVVEKYIDKEKIKNTKVHQIFFPEITLTVATDEIIAKHQQYPESTSLRFETSQFTISDAKCKEYVQKTLKKLTQLDWTYNHKKRTAFIKGEVDQENLKLLEQNQFKLIQGIEKPKSSQLYGQKVTMLDLKSVDDFERLAVIEMGSEVKREIRFG